MFKFMLLFYIAGIVALVIIKYKLGDTHEAAGYIICSFGLAFLTMIFELVLIQTIRFTFIWLFFGVFYSILAIKENCKLPMRKKELLKRLQDARREIYN